MSYVKLKNSLKFKDKGQGWGPRQNKLRSGYTVYLIVIMNNRKASTKKQKDTWRARVAQRKR